ncbi:MAG: DUF5678 domain-containing protein [Acidobacteria bacterium]|nr:DUF5678 domain-containing protein [Acidobacteriota bacterium]
MSQLTFEQVVNAIVEMPASEKARLLDLLATQLAINGEKYNGGRDQVKLVEPIPLPDPAPNRRWMEEHAEDYRGQWVALTNGQLIAHGADGIAVAKAADDSGAPIPLLVFIPPADALPFAGF